MQRSILWADDEIDLLKPHIIFLRNKGYEVTTVNSGLDAIAAVESDTFDLVILDENMPGITGLETLQRIKQSAPDTPVIMITKNEEEHIMDQAIGSKIADYLIKPVNPNQILLSIKRLLHSSRLVSEQSTTDYRREFGAITSLINDSYTLTDWMELYRKLVYWELELSGTDAGMESMLLMQKDEANAAFAKFVCRRYEGWVAGRGDSDAPLMSPDIFKSHVFPMLDAGHKPFFVLIDNFRFDQWCVIRSLLAEYFTFDESLYCSILPTATQYARNAIFSGLMPNDISRMFPELWIDEDEETSKNINESPLIATQFKRHRRNCRFSYTKINDSATAERLVSDFRQLEQNDLNVVVINFIDMLSHARTESRMIRELASTDAAYRSLTGSWFRHSPALELFRRMAASGRPVILTTDHGTIRVETPLRVVGDKNTNTNLRYKVGKNLDYDKRYIYEIRRPASVGLPAPNLSSAYIFATKRYFFAYPNNYNHYVQYYTGTFQHGGISMEEMLVPIVTLRPR